MREFLTKFISKSRLAVVATVLFANTLAGGLTLAAQPVAAQSPLSCVPSTSTDKDANIIYNGLAGSTADAMRQSLKTAFDSNDGGNCHTDLQSVYTAALGSTTGLSDSMLTDTQGWTTGQTTHDGKITTDGGVVVGTNTQVFSRCWKQNISPTNCEPSSRYTLVLNQASGPRYLGVYSHDTAWFMNSGNTPEKTLIHINKTTGQADFAVWKDCGNALRFTPVAPTKNLACVAITPNQDKTNPFKYTFTATATASYVVIDKYSFDFGNGSTQQVTGNNNGTNILLVTSNAQTYTQTDVEQTIVIKVVVSAKDNVVSASTCQTKVVITPKPPVKSLACVVLNETHTGRAYTFTATAQANNTTISTYTFDFGDGVKTAAQASNVATHTYADSVTSATASFLATGPLGSTPMIDACKRPIAFTLVRTGPGETLGLFAIASVAGVGFHQLVLRRKLNG